MKILLFFVFLIISVVGFSQNPTNYQYRTVRERLIATMVDSSHHLPRYNGVPSGLRVGMSANDGALASDTLNGRVYHYWNTVWNRLANYTDIAAGQVNIYNSDGYITDADRYVKGLNDTKGIVFDSMNYFMVTRNNVNRLYINSLVSRLNSPDESQYFATENDSTYVIADNNFMRWKTDSTMSRKKIVYTGNIHGLFNAWTLVDKSYVDSVVGGSVSTADGFSVLGRTGSSSGTAVSITAANNEDVLFKNGDLLQFAQPNLIKRQGNQIGYLLNKTSLADTVGLTGGLEGSATYTISGNVLNVVQTGADYSWVRYDSLTSLDVIELETVVSFNSFAGDTYSIQFGVKGVSAGESFPNYSRYYIYGDIFTGVGGQFGRMFIKSNDAGGNGTTLATSTSDLTIDAGDSLHVKFQKFENTIIFSARNLTDNGSWITVTYTLTGTQTSHSVGSIGILTGKQNYNIHQFKVSSKQVKNPDVYLFGDSKFTKSTYQNESLVALLKNNYGQVYANCAVGSTSADLLANMWEVINIVRPEKVLIAVSNDIRFGVASGTWQSNLTTIYNAMTAAGIDVYFASFYETSSSQSAMDTWLAANYPTKYIRRAYTELATNTGVLVGDNIHLSAFGNKVAYDAIVLDGKLNGNRADWYKDVTTIPPSIETNYGTLYNRLDSLRFKNDAGTEFTLGRSGSNPTLQEVLTAGATMTGNNTVELATFAFNFNKGVVNFKNTDLSSTPSVIIDAYNSSYGVINLDNTAGNQSAKLQPGLLQIVGDEFNNSIQFQNGTTGSKVVQIFPPLDADFSGSHDQYLQNKSGRIAIVGQGADIASVAGAISLGDDGTSFEITGTNAITLISNVGWKNGNEVTLIFTSTASLTDGTANSGTDIGMELAGNTNFTGSADDTITLILCEIGGTQRWREKCRSVN